MYHKYKNVERVKPSGLELVDRLVGVQRVTKVTKGGRAFGFSAIVSREFSRAFAYSLCSKASNVSNRKSISNSHSYVDGLLRMIKFEFLL